MRGEDDGEDNFIETMYQMDANTQKVWNNYHAFMDWLTANGMTESGFMNNTKYSKFRDDAFFLHDLRNVIGHKSKRYVTVLDESVKRIENFVSEVTCSLEHKMIPLNDLYTAKLSGKVLPALRILKSRNYSYLPIIDDDGVCLDVFSSYILMAYLCTGGNITNETTFEDIYDVIDSIILHKTVEYLPKKSSIIKVMDALKVTEDFHKDVVLVTQDGKCNSPVLGMITVWDL